MKKTPKIIIISGPSGSGKDTIIKGIMKKFPNLVMIKSYTTRPKRKSDEVGNRYFVSKEQFQKMIKHNKMIEYKKYCNNFYGRKKEDVEKILNQGKDIIMEVEVKGTLDYQKLYPDKVISIFIKYENPKQLIKRLKKNRPEISEKELQNRLKTMNKEMNYEKFYNYSIINVEGKPQEAINKVADIIRNVLK